MPTMLEQALKTQANALMDRMCSQNTFNQKTELQKTCIQENADMAVENPTLCSQSLFKSEQENQRGKGILIQNEHIGALSTLNNQAVAYGFDPGASRDVGELFLPEMSKTLSNGTCPGHHNGVVQQKENEPILLESNQNHASVQTGGISTTLPASMGMGGGYVPMVVESYQKTTGSLCASGYDKLGTQEAANDMYVVQSSWDGSQVSPTLTANNANGSQRMPDKENFNAVISAEVYHCTSENDKVQTLKARDYKDPQIVTYGLDRASFNQGANAKYDFSIEEEKIGAQVARGPGAVCQSVVRRLTPLECERLQGFPDGWTDIGDWIDSKGKLHKGDSDSPRYKALGNSIALPFWEWMAKRMAAYLPENSTMASLFDGIGGFPLVYSRAGVSPVWASEIEEFPIAVTKKHFKEEI